MLGKILESKKNVLIVVGFAHLRGNESFLNLLITELNTILKTKFRYSYKVNKWINWD